MTFKSKFTCTLAALLAGMILTLPALAQDFEFKGKIGKTLKDSEPYWPQPVAPGEDAPNVLVWLIDDMGFGHASPFGGLTPTPTLERLAANGLRFNNFHTTALCSPSRAAIAAGRNHHRIGMGSHSLTAMGFPGYNAHPPESAKGYADILKRAGWSTMFLGKWDHTPQWESTFAGPFDRWPSGDGWEHFYGFMSGDMNNFNPIMWMDHTPMQPNYDQPGYHVNEDMADTAIRWISMLKASAQKKPFNMFWATGAVHAPHHAPDNWIRKFRGKFDMGYDKAREQILANQIEMGIVPKGT
jgi:arylsulfatase